MTAFGFVPDACELRTVQPFGPLAADAATAAIAGIEAVNRSRTPIARALGDMADRLAAHEGPQTIVLVTDGEETCEGDVAATITDLRSQGVDVRVNIVGFAIDDAALKAGAISTRATRAASPVTWRPALRRRLRPRALRPSSPCSTRRARCCAPRRSAGR